MTFFGSNSKVRDHHLNNPILYRMSMNKSCRQVEREILRLLHGRQTRTQLPQIHARFLRHGLHQSNQILAHFVSVCGSFNNMHYANLLFSHFKNPNIFLFNSMIKGYSLCGPYEHSVFLFSTMRHSRILPDESTFAPLLKSCSNLCNLKLGQCLHVQILRVGFEDFASIGIGLVELYVNCEKMENAARVFDVMPHRDAIVWNLMIRGFCKMGKVDGGLCLFRLMNERSIVSWNTMLSGLAQNGRNFEALQLFREMVKQNFDPDEVTVLTMLPVCSRLGALDVGKWVHSYTNTQGLFQDVISIGNSLVDFYFKYGDTDMASEIFNKMTSKNVVSWNTMISGLSFNGRGEIAVSIFEEMIRSDVTPNDATFVGVLAACTHSGLVDKGRELFSCMSQKYKIKPKPEHYGCMVDLLGRSGCVKEAYELIKSMPMDPNAALWGALLSACRNHNNVKLAEVAMRELINLEPDNSGNYVLLSNILAEGERWDEVEKVRGFMKEKSIKKRASGQSAIG